MEKSTVEIEGKIITFFYIRKRIKNLILKVNRDNEIVISIPNRASLKEAKDFIIRKYDWIQKMINKNDSVILETTSFKENELLYLFGKPFILKLCKNKENKIQIENNFIMINIKEKYIENTDYIKRFYEKWLKDFSMSFYVEYVEKYQKIMAECEIPYPEIQVKKAKSRWGACFPKKNKIVLNLSLIKTPKECVEYVILHELSHFKYQNHSKNFYSFIEKFMPDWKDRRNLLNKKYTSVIV